MEDDSTATPRSKRQKIDKGGRFAALAKLKELKGSKHKLELDEAVDNVYDEVEEREYEKMVLARADDDWIEDDGTGYVEDGREIFDDEDVEEMAARKAGTSAIHTSSRQGKKRLRDINAPVNEKSNIKKMFSNAAGQKKKENAPKLAEDDILSDILGEISTNKTEIRPSPIAATRRSSKDSTEKMRVNQFMQGFSKAKADDDLLDKVFKKDEIKAKPAPSTIATGKTVVTRPKSPLPKSQQQVEETITAEPPVPDAPVASDDAVDMDYSILDDDENQFEAASSSSTSAPSNQQQQEKVSETDSYETLLHNWENTCNMMTQEEESASSTAVTDDSSVINDESTIRFWMWDAWEDPVKRPGQIFLFGKIAVEGKSPVEYKSACIKVEQIERCLYLLPREFALDNITKRPTKTAVNFIDVYHEFNDTITQTLNLKTFRSKKVSKNFAFSVPGVHVPATSDYLEVRYDGTKPLPSNKTKYNTIAHIFGTATNALELFLLDHKIKGPCWLNISKYTVNTAPLSWCKVELTCTASADSISVQTQDKTPLPPPPPLVLTTINVKTALNPKTTKNEVVMIAVLVNKSFSVHRAAPNPPFQEHFCGFTRPLTQNWPIDLANKLTQFRATKATKLDSERALLSWFLAMFQRLDPDLVVIHDANDCQLDVICDRVAALKLPMWSRIGRLRITQMSAKRFTSFFIGRLVCDVKLSAEELIKSRSYDLNTLCQTVLKTKESDHIEVTNEDIYGMYESAEGIFRLITLTMQDASFVLRLMCELNVLPLALQITNICGNLMSRTLQGGRSERNEFLLLHAFTEKNYIVPDKKVREWGDQQSQLMDATNPTQTTQGRKKPQYAGGLVLEPIKGFYDKFVLLMDFNSLYPSIIQEYNICFTTIDAPETGAAAAVVDTVSGASAEDALPSLPDPTVEQGVLPRQIRRLVESRREVKKLMASPDCDPDMKAQYNIRQIALKLTANSMYGCLGFTYSRFYAQHLAALVTFKGREILLNTKSLVQKLNFQVIYGDTDSIMINTNSTDYDQVFKVGHTIKTAVNRMYRQVELDIDGVFKYLLLLKKKKYAAVTITRSKKTNELVCTTEHKGLDIVRRDWSQISVTAGTVILDELLSDLPMDDRLTNIHNHLEHVRKSIETGTVPHSMLTITKQLTKPPKDYASTANLPHVTVALRMNAERNKRFKKGDMVPYVICTDGTDRPAIQRAYHLDELKGSETLKIDGNYYLANQIHPVVSRLCEPIEGTDSSRIAGLLGLDPSKFKSGAVRVQRERAEDSLGESIIKTTAQKYRDCERFTFRCVHCRTDNLVASAFRRNDQQQLVPVLGQCVNPECQQSPVHYVASIRNQLVLAMRKPVQRFYENWLVCNETNCSNNTRVVTHVQLNDRPVCLACGVGTLHRSYTERDLFYQLNYFQYMFDLSKHDNSTTKIPPELLAAYASLKETVDAVLSRSAYAVVKLADLLPAVTDAATGHDQ